MIYLIIYIAGFVANYLFYRYVYKDEWTISKRTLTLICSLASWIWFLYFIGSGIFRYIEDCSNNNNKAKW